MVTIAGKWYPATELAHQMAVWRSFDLTESNGLKIDAVVALKFPAYLVPHERKIVWLIHQHRSAYELWDHPEYGDLIKQEDGPQVRDLIWQADRVALGEAKRIFTNSQNVKDRLWSSLRIPSEVLYHPSPVTEALLRAGARAVRRLHVLPEPARAAEAAVARDRRDAARDRPTSRWCSSARVPTSARSATGSGGSGSAGQGADRDLPARRAALRAVPRRARACAIRPFDEDYGYVTIEGFAAERPVVTTTDVGGPLEFVTRRRDRARGRARSASRSPRRSTGSTGPRGRPPGWVARATRWCATSCRRWPDVVARLLD